MPHVVGIAASAVVVAALAYSSGTSAANVLGRSVEFPAVVSRTLFDFSGYLRLIDLEFGIIIASSMIVGVAYSVCRDWLCEFVKGAMPGRARLPLMPFLLSAYAAQTS